MTDAPKTMQLAPADWKQLCLLNVAQLHEYVSAIPAHTEAGASALTPELMASIESHVGRGRAFLRAWQLSRTPAVAAVQPAKVEQKANGAHEPAKPKGKGGWPKGKKRTPRVQAETQQ